jgi:hypothetical protein
MDLIALWAGYVALGGTKGADTIGRYLLGEIVLDASDHQLLVTVIEGRRTGSSEASGAPAVPEQREASAEDEERDDQQRG